MITISPQIYSDLLVILDFDKTITLPVVDNTPVHSIKTLLSSEYIISEEYTIEAEKLSAQYKNIEHNPNIPYEKRVKLMNESIVKNNELLKKFNFSKFHLTKLAQNKKIQIRKYFDVFVDNLNKNNIPALIVSASAIGEVIPEIFAFNNIIRPNQYFITNKFQWNKDDEYELTVEPIIQGLEKGNIHQQLRIVPKEILDRKIIVIIGDNVDDFEVSKNFSTKNFIKIGFFNSTAFPLDLSVEENGTFEPLNSFIFG